MGRGFNYHCDNCGKDYRVRLGVGMAHPSTCEETLARVKEGKYGQDLKEAAESETYVGVDAALKLYVCDACGHWDVYADASVYGLADKERGPSAMFGTRTIEEWGFIPYTTGWEDEIGFRVIKEFRPPCEKCGREMQAIEADEDSDETPVLKCPNCGSELSTGVMNVLWD